MIKYYDLTGNWAQELPDTSLQYNKAVKNIFFFKNNSSQMLMSALEVVLDY